MLIIGTCGVAGADRGAGQPSRPSLEGSITRSGLVLAGVAAEIIAE